MMAKRMVTVVVATLLVLGVAPQTPAAAETVPIYTEPDGAGPVDYEETLFGPFDLAANGEPGWQSSGADSVPRPPGAYGLKSVVFDIVDEDGNVIPRDDIMIHHFVMATVGRTDPACPGRMAGGYKVAPHVGTGDERTPIAIPDPYAMKVWDSEIWGATWSIMNLSDQQQTFYVRYTIGLQRDATNANTRWVTPYLFDAAGNCSSSYNVPGDGGPGSVDIREESWTLPREGVIVGTGGHLHDGGIATELLESDGDLICRSEATYEYGPGDAGVDPPGPADDMLDTIDPCVTNWQFDAGETFTLRSIYDNSKSRPSIMGMNVTFIWHGNQSDGVAMLSDVAPGHPFYDPIAWAVDTDIVAGYGDGTFQSTRNATRQAMMAWLYRLQGSPGGPFADPGFNDVAPGHPFYDPIGWAASEELTYGWPDGSFRSTACVSRQATMTFLYRLAGSPAGPFDDPGFTDVVSTDPFRDEIAWAVSVGVAEGYSDGSFGPTDCVTRQAAVAFLYRYSGLLRLEDTRQAYEDWVAAL